ncbi:DUF2515 family protein [Bacillus alkalicellulosilyticus]|uniref:DUF2515 family protein n=1 Tax=Alkalihalobacterium alkalicellulosilyticum TaxID=1912214 RepID=UPI000996DDDD|nr:DUF2515 family protein [Bacillus alkalicellulosilyticus]
MMYTSEESRLLSRIQEKVNVGNLDNISRTVFYRQFYERHQEIRWALLASMVSRNAGWNMTDLESEWFQRMLSPKFRQLLFLTYERANWLIFADVYPQLLVYEYSKKAKKPLFHLLDYFFVSAFIQKEWIRFWKYQELNRLCTALIVNEQHLIQKPVIEHPVINKKVFSSLLYITEEHLHFSYVLFPTLQGELYGYYVKHFTDVRQRIALGKRLAWLLFDSEKNHEFHQFSNRIEHTGSRNDFERFLTWKPKRKSPMLRTTFPVVTHHRHDVADWSIGKKQVDRFFKGEMKAELHELTSWYKHKLEELVIGMKIEEWLLPKR